MTPTLQMSTYDKSVRKTQTTYFLGYLWIFRLVKTFRGLIPVSAYPLGCQLYLFLVFTDDFAKSKVCDFDFTIVEEYILWLQIVVNDFLFGVCQILESTQNLGDDELSFFLLDVLCLFQIVVEVWTTT